MRLSGPPLSPDEAHLWLVGLDAPADEVERLTRLLSAAERLRAARFKFERDRRRFVVARGRLREVLATYLARSPAQVAFGYAPRGKPRLAGAAAGLTFSLSHTGLHALVGIARGREIGVDIEEIRPGLIGEAEAALVLSEMERREIDRLAPAARLRALLTAWVQKEAYAKARGDGLALDLRSIEVDVRAQGGLRRDGENRDAGARWCLRTLDVGSEFAAAIAVEGPAVGLRWCRAAPAFPTSD